MFLFSRSLGLLFLKTGIVFSRVALPFAAAFPSPPLNHVIYAMNLEEEVLMFVLFHKKFSKKKRRHQYWVHPLHSTRLETGQSQMAGSCSSSFVNN
jgi:hypothetical protein